MYNLKKYNKTWKQSIYTFQSKSKKKKKNEPPTWKEVRDAYLKSQVDVEDRLQKYSPNRHLEGIAMAIGFIGMILAISLLLAYVIVQAPQLRRKIGQWQFQRYFNSCRLNPNASPRYFQLSYFECLKSKYVQATVSTGSSHRQEKFISEAYYLILSNTSC